MSRPNWDISIRLGTEVTIRLCGLVTLPLLTRSLSSEGYGVVVGTSTIVGFFAAFGSLGLSYHIGRIVGRGESTNTRKLLRRLLIIACASGLGWCLALALTASFLNVWVLRHDHGALAIVLAGGTLFSACIDGILIEWIRLREKYIYLSLVQLAFALLQVTAIIAVVGIGLGPAAVIACASTLQLMRVASLAILIRLTPRAPVIDDDGFALDLRTCVRDGATLTIAALATWCLAQSGRLLLGNAATIGGYGAASALATIPGIAGSACGLRLYPSLVRAIASRKQRHAASAIRRYASAYQSLTAPVLVIAMILADDAIHLIAGKGFAGLGPICILLMIASWIEMTMLPLNYLLSAYGWATRTRNALLAGAFVSLATSLTCVPIMGAVGASIAVVNGQLATAALLAWGARHSDFPWQSMIPMRFRRTMTSAGIAALIAWAIPSSTWQGLLSAGFASLLAAIVVQHARDFRHFHLPRGK